MSCCWVLVVVVVVVCFCFLACLLSPFCYTVASLSRSTVLVSLHIILSSFSPFAISPSSLSQVSLLYSFRKQLANSVLPLAACEYNPDNDTGGFTASLRLSDLMSTLTHICCHVFSCVSPRIHTFIWRSTMRSLACVFPYDSQKYLLLVALIGLFISICLCLSLSLNSYSHGFCFPFFSCILTPLTFQWVCGTHFFPILFIL